jgi:hypothetical protein
MPFCPLPATFADDVRRLAGRGVLELGSGDGTMTRLLSGLGADPVTLDRRPEAAGCRARIRGDVLAPPLRGRFAVVVAANLLRHVWPAVRNEGPVVWRDLVADGGCLWILEDVPASAPPAARHYRDLQDLLARLDPGGRQPLLAREEFLGRSRGWNWQGGWQDGETPNTWPVDADGVVAWLSTGNAAPGGDVDRLCRAIAADGLAYGRAWWARWQPEEAT